MNSPPETHYATSGKFQIAYQAFGAGPDLVWVPGWVSQLDLYWEEPALARFLRRLATFARVIVFDRRGIGLSDRSGQSVCRRSNNGWTTSALCWTIWA